MLSACVHFHALQNTVNITQCAHCLDLNVNQLTMFYNKDTLYLLDIIGIGKYEET